MADQVLRIKDEFGNVHDLAFNVVGTNNYALLTQTVLPDSRNTFGETLSVAPGATATVATVITSSGYRLRGFNATGNGDGYFSLYVDGTKVLSGRIHATQKTVAPSFTLGDSIVDGATVQLKVKNESDSSCDFEGTIIGE